MKKAIFEARAWTNDGWVRSPIYKREHAAKNWAKGWIRQGNRVLIGKYKDFETYMAASAESVQEAK